MNYSIILLGATISVSLFIRICVVCGAIEVHSHRFNTPDSLVSSTLLWDIAGHDDVVYGWITDDPMFHFKTELKKSMISSSVDLDKPYFDWNEEGDSDTLNKLVEKMARDLQQMKKSPKHKRFHPKPTYDDVFYEHQICGSASNESHSETYETALATDEVPEGCYYENPESLSCNDPTLRSVPRLPPKLVTLTFQMTRIQKINGSDFGDVTIKNIKLSQNEIAEIDPWAFSKVKNLTTLEIYNNELEYLAFEIYLGLTEVVTLMLDDNNISFDIYQNCTIRDIGEIRPVLPKMRLFSLKGNPLKIIPPQMWAGLRNSPVNTLILANCQLKYIHEETFTFLTSLINLDLSNNKELMPNLKAAFKGLKNSDLRILSLSNNDLKSIPMEVEMLAHSLVTLDLSSNPIEYVTKESVSFAGLKKLKNLNLSNCKISSIDSSTIELLPELSTLDLSNNYLKKVPDSVSLMYKLTYLKLDNNPKEISETGNNDITFVIPPNAFANLTNLTLLYMNKVPLKHISSTMFTGLSKLSMISLENNNITYIEDLSFKDLIGLKSLVLRNSPLSSINSLTFYGLEKLETLYMENCALNFSVPSTEETSESTKDSPKLPIPENGDSYTPFIYLPSLQRINFTNNKIEYLHPRLFTGARKLAIVDLRSNLINSWNSSIFRLNYRTFRNDTESAFIVSNNKLSLITKAMLHDFLTFYAYNVDLSLNQFLCDEGACDFRNLVNSETHSKIFSSNITWQGLLSYQCLDPDSQQYYKIINVTDQVCKPIDKEMQTPSPPSKGYPPSSGSSLMTIAISVGCVIAFIAVAVATGYKKRVHLKYMWFVFKYNVKKIPRKSKTSVVELIHYDYDIFISYHNTDRDFIQDDFLPEVEEYSEQGSKDIEQGDSKGFRVCLHERDFEAGVPIVDNIVDSVDRSKKIVIVVSKNYLESQWCTFEMNLAYHRLIELRRSSLVLILLEEIPTELRTKVLNYLMSSRTYLEWPGANASDQEKKRFWSRLKSSLSTTS